MLHTMHIFSSMSLKPKWGIKMNQQAGRGSNTPRETSNTQKDEAKLQWSLWNLTQVQLDSKSNLTWKRCLITTKMKKMCGRVLFNRRCACYLLQVAFIWFVGNYVFADLSRSWIPAELHPAVGNIIDSQVSSWRHGHWRRTREPSKQNAEQRKIKPHWPYFTAIVENTPTHQHFAVKALSWFNAWVMAPDLIWKQSSSEAHTQKLQLKHTK